MHPAAEFIAVWFTGSIGRVFLASLPNPELKGTPEGEPNERHIFTRSTEHVTNFTAKWDRPGRAVYWAPATLKAEASARTKENIAELVALHADIDFKDVTETPDAIERIVVGLPLPPTRLRHTGHGLQAFWRFDASVAATPDSVAEHERLLRLLAERLGGDRSACDACHLMRLPGTTNSKGGDRLAVREILTTGTNYTIAALTAWLEQPQPPALNRRGGNGVSPDNPFLAYAEKLGAPLDVERMLAEMNYFGPGGGGNAHDTLLRCTASMLRNGTDVEATVAKALEALRAAAARAGLEIDPAREATVIREMCESWIEKHPEIVRDKNADDATRGVNFEGIPLTINEWLSRDLPPLDSLIGNVLTTTTRALLAAPTGIGKTNFGMALWGHAGLGKNFLHWHVPRPCRMLFIDGEMSRRLLRERIEALTRHLDGKPEWTLFFNKEDIEDFAPLNTREGHAAVWKLVEEAERRLGGPLDAISFDNIVSLLVGDMKEEDAWRDTMPLVRALTKRRIGQLWLHHTGHDTSRGYGTKTREWQLDLVMHLTETKRPDTDVSFTLSFPKARERTPSNREDFADINVALVDNQWIGDATTGGKEKPTPLALKFFEALQTAARSSSLTHISGYPIASLDEWQAQCVASGLINPTEKPDSARSLFSKNKLQLIAANWIAANTEAAWILP